MPLRVAAVQADIQRVERWNPDMGNRDFRDLPPAHRRGAGEPSATASLAGKLRPCWACSRTRERPTSSSAAPPPSAPETNLLLGTLDYDFGTDGRRRRTTTPPCCCPRAAATRKFIGKCTSCRSASSSRFANRSRFSPGWLATRCRGILRRARAGRFPPARARRRRNPADLLRGHARPPRAATRFARGAIAGEHHQRRVVRPHRAPEQHLAEAVFRSGGKPASARALRQYGRDGVRRHRPAA